VDIPPELLEVENLRSTFISVDGIGSGLGMSQTKYLSAQQNGAIGQADLA
jgi:hypothetical protein